QLRRRPLAFPPPLPARRSGRSQRGAAAGLSDRGPAVFAGAVAGRPRLCLVVEEDEVLLTSVAAVVARREAEDLGALDALVAQTRPGQRLQALELHALEREDVALRLRTSASVVADYAVRADHSVARDEVRDRIVGQRGADRAHCRRMADLARDPAVGPHLTARDLERLLQHRLRERRQAAQVELQTALAAQLILDLRRHCSRGFDPQQLPPDVLAKPLLELS